jgi:hypothetical protein
MATKGRAAALYRRPPEGGGKGSYTAAVTMKCAVDAHDLSLRVPSIFLYDKIMNL